MKTNGYWDAYENCYNEAMKYEYLLDFILCAGSAYNKSRRNGWLKDFTWLKRKDLKGRKPNGEKPVAKYTLEGKYIETYPSVRAAARSLNVKNPRNSATSIWRCCIGNSNVFHDFRWLYVEDMDRAEELFKERQVKRRYKPYTPEEVLAEASKYRTKVEFKEKAQLYLNAAYRLGIIDKLRFDRVDNPHVDKVYCVYAYEFKETHSVYIGLTFKKEKRHEAHVKDKRSSVKKHADKYNIPIPDPKYLIDNIKQKEALEMEDVWRVKYKEAGWNILNRKKTGLGSGSLGSCARTHTKKEIRECIAQCKTRPDFNKKFPKVYAYMCYHGLLGMLDCLETTSAKKGTYDEEWCFYTALQYDNVGDFMREEWSVYQISLRNGWFGGYSWLKHKKPGPSGRAVYLEQPFTDFEDWELVGFKNVKTAASYIGFEKKVWNVEKLTQRGRSNGLYFYAACL